MNSLLVSVTLLICAIVTRGRILENRVTRFFSSISMEFYLAHMALFRLVERLGLNTVLGNGWGQYLLTVVLVLAATALFAVVVKRVILVIEKPIMACQLQR